MSSLSASVRRESRTSFGVAASSRSTHRCREMAAESEAARHVDERGITGEAVRGGGHTLNQPADARIRAVLQCKFPQNSSDPSRERPSRALPYLQDLNAPHLSQRREMLLYVFASVKDSEAKHSRSRSRRWG
jgi:hypothetical protein